MINKSCFKMTTTANRVSEYSSYAEQYKYSTVNTIYLEAKDDKGKDITALPADLYKYKNLHTIVCQHNKIKNVDILQFMPHIKQLYLKDMRIKSLDLLPPRLEILHCIGTDVTSLDNLPNTLKELQCHGNEKLRTIQNMPEKLQGFACNNNPSLIYGEEPTLNSIREYQRNSTDYICK